MSRYVVVTDHTVPADLAPKLREFVEEFRYRGAGIQHMQLLMSILNYAAAIETAQDKVNETHQ